MDDADQHFQATIGALPESVAVLRRMSPSAMRDYAETRARLYRPPPEGHLPVASKELVFIVLDVVAGHVDGACAHAAAALAAGLSPAQIMEALEICILIHGHHTWARAGMAVMLHVERLQAQPA